MSTMSGELTGLLGLSIKSVPLLRKGDWVFMDRHKNVLYVSTAEHRASLGHGIVAIVLQILHFLK